MPPPMSEKQVSLQPSFDEPPSCLATYGHTTVAFSVAHGGSLITFDAEKYDQKAPQVTIIKEVGTAAGVNPSEVYKIIAFKNGDSLSVVMVENQVGKQVEDKLTVVSVKDGLQIVKQVTVPKVYSICLSAGIHHSGFFENDTTHDNSHYTSINSANLP